MTIADPMPLPFMQPAADKPELIRNGRYYLPPIDRTKPGYVGEGGDVARTRVTTFAKILADDFALHLWEKRLVARGVALREDLRALVAAVDVDEDPKAKDKLNKLCEQAKEFAGGNYGSNMGTAFHGFTEVYDAGRTPTAPEQWAPKLDAYGQAQREHGLTPLLQYLERIVVNERYSLTGRIDRVFMDHSGGLLIGDVKSQSTFWTWEEIAIQLAIYANSSVVWDEEALRYEDMPPVSTELAVVLWMPITHPGGDPDHVDVFNLPIDRAWTFAAETCERARTWRREAKKLGYLRPPVDLSLTEKWARRLADAVTLEELSAVYAEASERGQWTRELQDVGMRTMSRIQSENSVGTLLTHQRERVE